MTNVGRRTFPRRLAGVFMALAMLVMSMPADMTVFAEGAPWEDSGTATDPWRIMTPEDLISMSNREGNTHNTELYKDNYFALMNDIDLTGVDFAPIGTYSVPFYGTFYGCGYSIKNLTINKTDVDNVGLFSRIKDGFVRDLKVEGSVTGYDYVGGIAGSVTNSRIKDCSFR